MQAMGAVLFYTVGLPGAGKTTFATRLSNWLQVEHLRGDKIGLELFRFPTYSPQERRQVHAEMQRRAVASLRRGHHVVYDAAVNTRAQRDQLAQLAQQHGGTALGVWLQTDLPVAKKRASMARDSGIVGIVVRVVPPHLFDHYAAAFEIPGQDEMVALIPGDAHFARQYAYLRRQLGGTIPAMPRLVQ
jgi:predicted kinase